MVWANRSGKMETTMSPQIGDIVTHRTDGWQARIESFSPDGTIVDVVTVRNNKGFRYPLSAFKVGGPIVEISAAETPATSTAQFYSDQPSFVAVTSFPQPVRVAMGPIIGAILLANLISGIIGAIVFAMMTAH